MSWRKAFGVALACVVVGVPIGAAASVAVVACLAAALEALCRVTLGMGEGARTAATVAALVGLCLVGLTSGIKAISEIVAVGAGADS